ncbi:MAG: hypothetical protein DMF85_19875 [Acidobacteria bacterium]|nr:MAG: hypothetical protein DMF85_19875 [Acidobacteriota bacterium]PYR72392.1 MAG: hypothetical protein DMF86_23855 [Acidobacteriota bacterium]
MLARAYLVLSLPVFSANGALEQFEKPLVAERSAVPPVPKVPELLVFSGLTKFSTPGDDVAAIP